MTEENNDSFLGAGDALDNPPPPPPPPPPIPPVAYVLNG